MSIRKSWKGKSHRKSSLNQLQKPIGHQSNGSHLTGNYCPSDTVLQDSHMRMFFDIVSQTLRTLWAHKLRSFLTMFGIAWGVGSLLLLVGLGEGFRSGNEKELNEIGESIMFSFPGNIPPVEGSHQGMRPYQLTYSDVMDIRREAKHVHYATPVMQRGDLKAVSQYQSSAGQTFGVEPIYNQIRFMPLGGGRWFNEEDNNQKRLVVFIGIDMKKNMFP